MHKVLHTAVCAKGFALWKPTNFCVQKFDKKLLFCAVGKWAMFGFLVKMAFAFIAPENEVKRHSPKDCIVGRLLLYFLRKYKERNCPRVHHAKKAQHGAVLFWRGESIKKGSGRRNVFFFLNIKRLEGLKSNITIDKFKIFSQIYGKPFSGRIGSVVL